MNSDWSRVKQENESINMDLYSLKELSTAHARLQEQHGDAYHEVKRTDGEMDGQTDGRTDRQTDGWTDGRTDGQRDKRTNGRTDEWIQYFFIDT